MEGVSFLWRLDGHYELSAMILAYLAPRDLIKLLLLNHKTNELLQSSTFNSFWFWEIQHLPRANHIHVHPPLISAEQKNPCKHSGARLRLRNFMAQTLSTPIYCNWLRNIRCQNWSHYFRRPSYDTYTLLNPAKPHIYRDNRNYFENWKKKLFLKAVWWNRDEYPSGWLTRQEAILLIKCSGDSLGVEEKDLLYQEISRFYNIRDTQLPDLIKQISNKAELYKKGILEHQRKNPPWIKH